MKKVSFVLSCLLVLTMVASADVITISDVVKVEDAYLAGYGSITDNNYGGRTGSGLYTIGWASAGKDNRVVVRFDVSEIPVGSIINSATLNVGFRATPYGNSIAVDVHKIAAANAGWVEGNSNDVDANPGEVCWDYKNYNTAAWAGSAGLNTPGTDYDTTALATVLSHDGSEGSYGIRNASIGAAAVQDWVNNPAGNAGLLFKLQDIPAYDLNQVYMCSTEFATSDHYSEPYLVIDYTPVPEPMTVVLLGLGGLLIRRKK